MRIAILGTGGVGGCLGGLMAQAGYDVHFIARGEHLRAIQEEGLHIQSSLAGNIHIFPCKASEVPSFQFDVVFVCVKGYSLDAIIPVLNQMVSENTLVVPLLNGVGIGDRIAKQVTSGIVLDGCTYIVSYIDRPGHIVQNGAICRVIYGPRKGQTVDNGRLHELCDMLKTSKIDAHVSDDIESATWTKYAFICSFGACACFYNANAGQIQSTPEFRNTMKLLCEEIIAVAKAQNIKLPEDTLARSLKVLDGLSPTATASLHRDLMVPGKPNELELFSIEMVKQGSALGADVAWHRKVVEALAHQ